MSDISRILARFATGDASAPEELLPLVYDELRRLASQKLASERPGQTVDATGLVHEAYLRLVPSGPTGAEQSPHWNGRGHFFAAAAVAMRRILVETARRKRRLKRGGDLNRVDLNVVEVAGTLPDEALLALDDALARLAEVAPEKAKLIELRFFTGMTNEEAALALGISTATAKRHWRYARAWLHREITAT